MKTKMNQHLAKQRQKLIKALTLHKKKPKDSSSRLLESCPVDIVDAIVRHLPLEDFRNLRLVNKAINLATILLFTRKYLHTLEIDFTRQGLQRAIEITSHYDVSGTVCFGPRIDTIVFDFENFVWTSEKECAWLSIRLDTFNFNPLQRRGMKKEARKEARKAAQQWRDHREMLVQDGYFQMLATIFRQVERMTVKTHDLRALTYDNLGAYILQVRPRHWWGSVRCKYALSSQERSVSPLVFFKHACHCYQTNNVLLAWVALLSSFRTYSPPSAKVMHNCSASSKQSMAFTEITCLSNVLQASSISMSSCLILFRAGGSCKIAQK